MIRYSEDYNPVREYWNKIQSGEEVVGAKIRKVYKKLAWDLDHPGEYFYSPKRANHILEFAEIVNELGKYYNNAFLVVEKASGGHSVIERLRYTYGYMNMSKYKTYDERGRARTQIGFDTNNKTKGIIVNDFREAFETGLIQINSIELLEEMKTFVATDNKYSAMRGRHDDIIMAWCLALAGLKQGKWYI